MASPIIHIFNQSINWGVSPQVWKEVEIIPLPKNAKANLTGANSHPVSILSVLAKIMEKIIFNQIHSYFSERELNTDFLHAYGVNIHVQIHVDVDSG